MREKKVLLMGEAAIGKSSMRAVIFKNTMPDLTRRLTTTNYYETEKYRFFDGANALSVVDCGGQIDFFESYLSDDGQQMLFAHVSALIYVFEAKKLDSTGRPLADSLQYFCRCLEALQKHSPNAPVFVLIQKMDLVDNDRRQSTFDSWVTALREVAEDATWSAYGTSIYEDTLYRAWSAVIQVLVPNIAALTQNLNTLAKACGAVEAAIFEKNTFLLVARSSTEEQANESLVAVHDPSVPAPAPASASTGSLGQANRFEMISKLIKAFKHDAKEYAREPFRSLQMQMEGFTLVLTELTTTSYILIIGTNDEPRITPEAINLNIVHIRNRFEDLQAAAK
ncbi:GTP-binding protein gtr1 [Serendipita sp. 411]|nr:GTP-binding protein gtr1 [Serendipita sp. 401]KAG8861276.1 GTP-binding protein gtr1 [Serendipita sp. 411]